MSQPPEARPKGVTIAFEDAGDGFWRMEVEIVDAADGKTSMGTRLPLDGSPVTFERNAEADPLLLYDIDVARALLKESDA